MSLSELKKEQKQMVVLGVLVGVTVVYALLRFVLLPLMSGDGQKETVNLEDLINKVENAENLVKSRRVMAKKHEETSEAIQETAVSQIPPVENSLSWVTERIYKIGRTIGMNIESIGEAPSSVIPKSSTSPERVFKPYAVRIVTKCSYDQVSRLIDELQKSNPCMTVSGISISEYSKNPLEHRVNLTVEWPFWDDPAKFHHPGFSLAKEAS